MRKTLFGFLMGLVALTLTGQATAQNYTDSSATESPWHVGAGIIYVDRPYTSYDSDEKTGLFPLVIKRSRHWFVAGNHGGFRLLPDNKDFDVDIIARVNNFGYESSDSSALSGMSDRDPSLEAGVKGTYQPGKWGVSAFFVHDITDEYDGAEAYGEIFWIGNNGPWTARYSAGGFWRSDDFVDHYFGVRASEATATRPAYSADDEIHGQLAGTVSYDFQAPVSLWIHVNMQFFGDEVDDSPIVSDESQITGLVGVTYRF